MTVLYIVGPPGVGKTTLVRALLALPQNGELPLGGYYSTHPKWTILPDACAAGIYDGGLFDGADTIPAPRYQAALDFWAEDLCKKPLTVLDGDRFSHAKALDFLAERARVIVAHLTAPDEVHAARRAARGSKQDATWVKGRITKAANFAKLAADKGHAVATLDAQRSPAELASALRTALS
jgi:ABC-type cobalamin/Fe3+-siderophores transport system ATPase subunit